MKEGGGETRRDRRETSKFNEMGYGALEMFGLGVYGRDADREEMQGRGFLVFVCGRSLPDLFRAFGRIRPISWIHLENIGKCAGGKKREVTGGPKIEKEGRNKEKKRERPREEEEVGRAIGESGNRIERLAIWNVLGLVEFNRVFSWLRTARIEINYVISIQRLMFTQKVKLVVVSLNPPRLSLSTLLPSLLWSVYHTLGSHARSPYL